MIYTFYTTKNLPQLVGDQFADEVAVGLARGEGTVSAIILEKLVGVREVEVPGEEERVLQFARLMHERVAKRHLVLPEGGVAQMPEENPFLFFATKITKVTKFFLFFFVLFAFFVAK